MKKLISLFLSLILTFTLCACGGGQEGGTSAPSGGGSQESMSNQNNNTANTEIYFLNFKPEVANVFEEIAEVYENETGVRVKVVTAASDTYEQTLTSEITKSNPPTIFQINGPVGYENWKNYCADLSDSRLYELLEDDDLAIKRNGGVYGIPYAVEGYGIIYNEEITDKYFELQNKGTNLSSMKDVNSFTELKALVEDMQKNKEQLGIDGVFASTSFSSGNQWRWNTHLLNVPFHLEMDEIDEYDNSTEAGLESNEFKFRYGDNFKNIFDLYLDNSVTSRGLIGSKSVGDSMAEFALGKAAMVQNGNWAYSEIKDLSGNVVSADKIKMLPIYTGTENEAEQGLCIGTENYLAINAKASDEKRRASEDFLVWLFSSEKGMNYVTKELGFITPFESFENKTDGIEDPLAREVLRWSQMDDIDTVPWAFTAFPSIEYKEDVASALLEYAQGTSGWERVESAVSEGYARAKQDS